MADSGSLIRKASIVALALSLGVVVFPTFDRQDLGPIKELRGKHKGERSLGDSPYYVNYVLYFRGDSEAERVPLPFRYRPLAPFVASLLPIKNPMTAINVLNLICLYTGLLLLNCLLRKLGFGFGYSVLGCFMFTISFPVFYYGAVGGADPVLICLLIAGTYLIFAEKWSHLAAVLISGSMVKEVIVLLIPVALAFLLVNRYKWRLKLCLFLLAYLVPTIAIRVLFMESGSYSWYPSLAFLMGNIRFRAIFSVLLSFGFPGFLSLFFIWGYKRGRGYYDRKLVLPLLTGVLFTLLLVVFSFVAAYTDGRFMWPSNIYTIPLSLLYLKSLRE